MQVLNTLGSLLVASLCILIMLPIVTPGKTMCFCNSPACIQSVCTTEHQCYARIMKAHSTNDTINSTSVRYGCEEELLSPNSQACPVKKLESTRTTEVICCKGSDLCNMPNLLRAVILADKKTEDLTPASSVSPHTPRSNSISVDTMKIIGVIVPSLLIIFVVLLSLCIFHKLTKFHAKRLESMRRMSANFGKSYMPTTVNPPLHKKRPNSRDSNHLMARIIQNSGATV